MVAVPKFHDGQRVRVRDDGGDRSSQPDMVYQGKEGIIQYGTGNLDGGPSTFYFVGFDRPPRHKVMAISPDWLEPW